MRLLLFGCITLLGCNGVIGDPVGEPTLTEPDPPAERPTLPSLDECADAPVDSGGRPLSRLTRVQYQNTLADLLNVDAAVAEGFVEDERVAGFEAARTISSLHVEKYLEAARELAREADLPMTCTSGEDCARGFIADFGRRAFRRELTGGDVDDLLATWRVGNESSFDDGIRLVIEATLGSPDFLYHV
ncbi:MAG: DUF1587 domain-containing protein, partial [Myxococcota bacterium]